MFKNTPIRSTDVPPGPAMEWLYKGRDESGRVVLNCGEVQIPAHAVILRSRSIYFRNCLEEGRFKEGETKSVNLDHPPKAMELCVKYMYLNKYDPGRSSNPLVHVQVYHAADELMLTGLKHDALEKFQKVIMSDPEKIFASLPSIAECIYSKGDQQRSRINNPKSLLLHVLRKNIMHLLPRDNFRQIGNDVPELFLDLLDIQAAHLLRDFGHGYCSSHSCQKNVTTHPIPACDECNKSTGLRKSKAVPGEQLLSPGKTPKRRKRSPSMFRDLLD